LPHDKEAKMNGWEIAGVVILAIIVLELLINIKDLFRYIKISSM
jgi:hypothetical protein